MKKYFVLSDIHSFFNQMLDALSKSGFDINNPNHIIIICGDVFDRGTQSLELFEWLIRLPEDRLILIQGNHELLYFELLEKDFPESHDFSNGTVTTFCALAGVDKNQLNARYLASEYYIQGKIVNTVEMQLALKNTWKKVVNSVKNHPATEWLKNVRWRNYFELDNFIFVHSFLPLRIKSEFYTPELKYYPTYYGGIEDHLELVPNWRFEANILEWDDAKWGCPWKQFASGLFNSEIEQGKRLVCGHWHASDFHKKFNADNSNNLNIFFSENLIALDACTAASGFCNVLVLDTETRKCFDQNTNYLGDF